MSAYARGVPPTIQPSHCTIHPLWDAADALTGVGDDLIRARAPPTGVGALAPIQLIVPRPAHQDIVPGPAPQEVIPPFPEQAVLARIAKQPVIAVAPTEGVIPRAPSQMSLPARPTITSSPGVPSSTSSPGVPTRVATCPRTGPPPAPQCRRPPLAAGAPTLVRGGRPTVRQHRIHRRAPPHQGMGPGIAAVVRQGRVEDGGEPDASRGHQIGGAGREAGDASHAVHPKQIEVVGRHRADVGENLRAFGGGIARNQRPGQGEEAVRFATPPPVLAELPEMVLWVRVRCRR